MSWIEDVMARKSAWAGWIIRALWRLALVSLFLAGNPAHSMLTDHHGGHEPHHVLSQATDAEPDSHCPTIGHCASVFVLAAPQAEAILPADGQQMIATFADAAPGPGRIVDPGRHPPKLLRAS